MNVSPKCRVIPNEMRKTGEIVMRLNTEPNSQVGLFSDDSEDTVIGDPASVRIDNSVFIVVKMVQMVGTRARY